ncbi:MAG: DEAD/DEAH box helicase [Chloroflexi bacterium]|nr:DEAD/DEAH box helicase [Chloroflexota bacterium]
MSQLYTYQERVRQLMLAGRSIILQAPTGAGKTRASLTPFWTPFGMRLP